jgi:UDP-N-acetyl-2-amino-2-deoxyglucuronate dehydrogenase
LKRFAIIGAAGYIAPRHLNAIRDVGGQLVVALDKHDSVGILDNSFPEAKFFTEFERFDRHVDRLTREGQGLDYVAIASPNYLHDAHCRFALRSGAEAICEKPLVINPWNIDGLRQLEKETGGRINTILQLRVHPSVIALRQQVQTASRDKPSHRFTGTLHYVTSRGSWYHSSWKGDEAKSGGIAVNIGIHFFDMLLWVFGPVTGMKVERLDDSRGRGTLSFANADVDWFLSIDAADVPADLRAKGQRTYRNIVVDGQGVEFSDGFTDLHTVSYRKILAGEGFGLDDAEPSIQLVHDIRAAAGRAPARG